MRYRIAKTHDFGDSLWYKAICECCTPEHDLDMNISCDDFPSITLEIYAHLSTRASDSEKWLDRQWRKIKYIYNILVGREIESDCCFMMSDEKQIQDFIDTMNEALNELKERSEE